MFEANFFFVLGIFLVGVGAAIAVDESKARWLSLSAIGVVFLGFATFGFAPRAFPNGAPIANIGAGEYGVAYVGPFAAGHVDVLTFKDGQDSKQPMIYRRLPKDAFDGEINTGATKLTVVVSPGGFKKLVLE